jgi:hypothetical protein
MHIARSIAQSALEGYLDDVQVEPYSRLSLSSIAGPAVLVKLEEVEREPSAPMSHRRYVMELVLVTPLTEAPAADDELDALLEDVVYALEQSSTFDFERATRGVFEGTQTPCYGVRCSLIAPKPAPPEPTP